MLETKCVRDNFEMLVTVFAIFVTNILYLSTLSSGTNIQKMSPISKFYHQHPKIITNIKSPTSTCHQHLCNPTIKSPTQFFTNITLPITSMSPLPTICYRHRCYTSTIYSLFMNKNGKSPKGASFRIASSCICAT